jgi:hypothetical protein
MAPECPASHICGSGSGRAVKREAVQILMVESAAAEMRWVDRGALRMSKPTREVWPERVWRRAPVRRE